MLKFEKIKTHFRENRKTYFACGGTAVVAVIGTKFIMHRRGDILVSQTLSWKPRAEFSQTTINLIERSTPSKPVHLVGTNLYFNSLGEAARKTGHSLSSISQQVNGHRKDVNGDIFEVLEVSD